MRLARVALRLQNRGRMRRTLLAIVAAFPMAALAVTAGNNQVVELTNFDPTAGSGLSYINAAHCAGAAPLQLEWLIPAAGTPAQDDLFNLYASDTNPSQNAAAPGFCVLKDQDNPTVRAAQIDSIHAAAPLASTSIPASAVVGPATSATDIPCDAAKENTSVFICAHWTDSGGTVNKGVAVGQFQLQLRAPNKPGGVSVQGADSKLRVSWTANGIDPVRTEFYIARAFAAGTTDLVKTSPRATGASTTITDLENGQLYDVDVVAFSVGGNPSAGSDKQLNQSPVPSGDFWDVYKTRGGVEQGGCASGSAGMLALLGVASLLAFRRRNS